MKEFFKRTTILGLTIAIFFQVLAPSVYAQEPENIPAAPTESISTFEDNDASNASATGGRTTTTSQDFEESRGSGSPEAEARAATAASQKSSLDLSGVGICDSWHNFLSFRCLGYGLFVLGAWVSWIGGIFLNFSIQVSILDMKALISGIGAVNVAWDVLRDLANIFFIFILIYIAISTITGLAGGNTKRMLVSVILVAMFINFSLFFTKVIVDASNIVTVQFYHSIAKGGDPSRNGISWVFMEGSRLPTLFKNPADGAGVFKENSGTSYLTYGILSLVFGIILAFAFLAIGILFIIRLVMIIYLMILSPIALLGHTVPKLKPMWEDWWDNLLNQAIFAPIMMLMLWVTAMVVNSPGFMAALKQKDGTKALANIASMSKENAASESMYIVINFAILIAMLLGGIMIAKKFGTWGSGAVTSTFDKWSRKAAYAPLRLGARGAIRGTATLGRASIGRAANALSKIKGLERVAATGNVATRTLARGALAATKGVAKSSFDIRATGVGQNISGDLGLGKAKEGGWKGYVDSQEKKEKSFAESLKSNIYANKDVETYVSAHEDNAGKRQGEIALLQEKIFDTKKKGGDTSKLEEELAKAIKERDASLKQVKDINEDRTLATGASREFVRKSSGTIWDRFVLGGATANIRGDIDKKFDKGDTKWASEKELYDLQESIKEIDAKLEADKSSNLTQNDVIAKFNEKINKNLEKIAEYNQIIAEAEQKRNNNIFDPEIKRKADKATSDKASLLEENGEHNKKINELRSNMLSVNDALTKAAEEEKIRVRSKIKTIKNKKDEENILAKIKKVVEPEEEKNNDSKKNPEEK